MGEIGSTERRFEVASKKRDGRAEVRGKEGVWIVFETDLLRVVRSGSGFGKKGGKVQGFEPSW